MPRLGGIGKSVNLGWDDTEGVFKVATLIWDTDSLAWVKATVSTAIGPTSAVEVTNFPATQPISVSALPLPAGAATGAKQDTGNTSLGNIDGKTPSLGQAAMVASVPVVIASNQSPIPVTGSISASNPSVGTTGAAVPSSATEIGVKDAGGNLQPVVQGQAAMAASIPVAIASDQGPVPASQSGNWDVRNVAGTVSLPTGAATGAKQDTGNTSLGSIDGKLTTTANGLKTDGSAVIQPISAAALPLPSGAATGAKQDTGNTSLGSIDGKLSTTANGLKVDNSGVIQPISAAALPLPGGAATGAKQDTGNVSLASIDSKITAVNTGSVTVASSALPSGAATGAKQDTGNTSLSNIDSKTPALGQALAAASTPVVLASDQTLPLPSGAATSAKQDTGNASLASIDSKNPSLGQAAASACIPVVVASDQKLNVQEAYSIVQTRLQILALQTFAMQPTNGFVPIEVPSFYGG